MRPDGVVPFQNYLGFLPREAREAQGEFLDSVFSLPFVSAAWKQQVNAYLAANPTDYIKLIPPVTPSGAPGERPDFINTPERVKAWGELQRFQDATLLKIINGWGNACLFVKSCCYCTRWRSSSNAKTYKTYGLVHKASRKCTNNS